MGSIQRVSGALHNFTSLRGLEASLVASKTVETTRRALSDRGSVRENCFRLGEGERTIVEVSEPIQGVIVIFGTFIFVGSEGYL